MSLISIILTLVVIGVLLWLINTFIPMQPAIKTIINVLIIILVIVWLVRILGGGTISSFVPESSVLFALLE